MKTSRLYMMPQTGSVDTFEEWMDLAMADAKALDLTQQDIDSVIAQLVPVVYDEEAQQWIEED